jgi:hypothetical protein
MATTVRKLLGGTLQQLPQERTDIVAVSDGSVSVHSRDSYDDDGEVDGIGKVLIVELKRGGSTITDDEINQAKHYAKELRKAHSIQANTKIVAFVLGSTCADDASEDETVGPIKIKPRRYDTIIKRAHARMFNLQRHIKCSPFTNIDADVEEIISRPRQLMLEHQHIENADVISEPQPNDAR